MIKRWLYNARSFAAPQNLMPSLLTVVLAIGMYDFSLWLGLLATVAVCAVHLGGNLLDDYFDYKYDILDYRLNLRAEGQESMTDKYPYLRDGSTTLGQLRLAIGCFFGFAMLCGGIILWFRGWSVVLIAALAAFLCFFYSAPPFKLGFHGLGELVIGMCFGPCLMCGVYESACGDLLDEATGELNWTIIWLSVAIGLFVTNILYTHSVIERHTDEVSHKKTLAVLLHSDWACLLAYGLFLFAPFGIVVGLVATGVMHWANLLVCLMLPQACWLMWAMVGYTRGVKIDTAHPHRWLGPMDNWEQVEEGNRDYFLRWFAMRNINTGFCLILAVVHLCLVFFI